LLLGFASGLPYMLVFSTLSAWLRDVGISLTEIGFFAWLVLTYSLKFLWAPFVDRYSVIGFRIFGKRRGWILFSQFMIFLSLIGMSLTDPLQNLKILALLAFFAAFFGSIQDIAIDALRIEIGDAKEQGNLAASYQFGYRVAILVATSMALIFADLLEGGLSGMLHYKEIAYDENIENLNKFKKNDLLNVKIIEIKDDKIRFSKRALDKDPLEWFDNNKKKVGDIITTRIHEVLKTGVKVSIDKDKKIITTIRKADLAKESADARPEIFSPGNALDAKITELDIKSRKIKLSVKAAQIEEEKSLMKKFGANAAKSGATLKGIFEKAIGKKGKKEK